MDFIWQLLYYEQFRKCEKFLNKDKEVAIINGGLLRYLTFDEKKL